MTGAQKAKHLDVTTIFTYFHANTPVDQSERTYYLFPSLNNNICHGSVLCAHRGTVGLLVVLSPFELESIFFKDLGDSIGFFRVNTSQV